MIRAAPGGCAMKNMASTRGRLLFNTDSSLPPVCDDAGVVGHRFARIRQKPTLPDGRFDDPGLCVTGCRCSGYGDVMGGVTAV